MLMDAVGGAGVAVDPAGDVVAGDPGCARVLAGAHCDAAPGTPAADDNASGVAWALRRATGARRE